MRLPNTHAMHMKEKKMNNRICSVIAIMTLMSFSTGCTGIKNFLFGRGARCGLRSGGLTPQFGNAMQAPNSQQPGCGCNGQVYSAQSCGGCGVNDYGVADPYQSGQMMGGAGVSAPADSFNARKFDNDGSRILWEQPVGNNSL